MNHLRWVFLILFLLCASLRAAPEVGPPDFNGAQWIWDEAAGTQKGSCAFRKAFAFPAGKKPVSAELAISCDNLWTLYVNGAELAKNDSDPDSWKRPRVIDVSQILTIEQNSIAIEGANTVAGPSGLLMKMKVVFEDGSRMELVSDESWISIRKPEKNWQETGFVAGDGWTKVTVRGEHGIDPWGKLSFIDPKKANKPKRIPKVYPRETDSDEGIYQDGIVFVSDSSRLASPGEDTYVQHIKGTRAYFELDPMTPAAIGDKLGV